MTREQIKVIYAEVEKTTTKALANIQELMVKINNHIGTVVDGIPKDMGKRLGNELDRAFMYFDRAVDRIQQKLRNRK